MDNGAVTSIGSTEKIQYGVIFIVLCFIFQPEVEYKSGFRYMFQIQEEMSDRQLLHIQLQPYGKIQTGEKHLRKHVIRLVNKIIVMNKYSQGESAA